MSPIEAASYEAALSQFGVKARVWRGIALVDGEILTDAERILPALALADCIFEALTGQRTPKFVEQFEGAAKRAERHDHEALFGKLRRNVCMSNLFSCEWR